jgi:flagellar biosynthesis/type III secretory pathway protein FliH
VNQGAITLIRILELLETKYPEIVTEVSTDGKQFIPLHEMLTLDERFKKEIEAAYQQGKTEGHASGRAEGREEAQRAFSAFGSAVNDCIKQRKSLLREAELHITEMVLKIARNMTFGAAKVDPDVTMGVVKGAVDSLVDKREISVRVHPDHLEHLKVLMDEFDNMSGEVRELSLEGDVNVKHGGCFIRTPAGDIDARLDSQFKIIEDAVLDETS